MIRCPECKKIVDEKNNSCQYCGYPFNGTEEKITIKYCTECGAPIEEGLGSRGCRLLHPPVSSRIYFVSVG